jgi:hypothetical protein
VHSLRNRKNHHFMDCIFTILRLNFGTHHGM